MWSTRANLPLTVTMMALAIAVTDGRILRFPFKKEVSLNGQFNLTIRWELDWVGQSVDIGVVLDVNDTLRWVAVGFSDHGAFEGSDYCMLSAGSITVQDGWVAEDGSLVADRQQDCDQSAVYSNAAGKTTFVFRRKFHTCDWKDYAIEDGSTQFLVAAGFSREMNINAKSAMKMIVPDRLFRSERKTARRQSRDVQILRVRSNAVVPANETTYWCAVVKLPTSVQATKHHIVKIEAAIEKGNEHLVHHMEVYHCAKPPHADRIPIFNGWCNAPDKPKEVNGCSRVIGAWAMGAPPIEYPPEAGTAIGGSDFFPYFMVEVHYNNPAKRAGVKDNSGLNFHYTSKLRQYDAGIMELGLIYSDVMAIPPRLHRFPLTGYCVADCTAKFPPEGINIFATQLHSHLTGRKMWTTHYRDGIRIGQINRDHHYSAHWQEIRSLVKQYTVLPGDVLATTCLYDSRQRKNVTLGGYEIVDEMCVNYVHYYPKSDVEVCKSAINNATLSDYFRQIGQGDREKLTAEKYRSIEWDKKKIADLAELYATAPLNMACLQHNGQLFPGHPTNWIDVPLPKIRYAPFDHARANFECPALND